MLRQVLCAHLLLLCFSSGAQQGGIAVREAAVASAVVGSDGLVHIRRGSGADFIAPLEKSPVDLDSVHGMQVSVEPPIVAEDGRTVGCW